MMSKLSNFICTYFKNKFSLSSAQMKRLQTIQNALARAVTKTLKHHRIAPVLKSLHWPEVPQRIHYKIVSLPSNVLQTSQPSYIRQLLTIQPPRSIRSSLSRPPVSPSLKFCIAYAAPALWSGLPKDLRHFAHPPPSNLPYHPLSLSSATFNSPLE